MPLTRGPADARNAGGLAPLALRATVKFDEFTHYFHHDNVMNIPALLIDTASAPPTSCTNLDSH
jgi:hypothetical protein